jgi:hypothetical protein
MTIMKLTARTPKRVTAFMATTLACDAVRRREALVLSIMDREETIADQ